MSMKRAKIARSIRQSQVDDTVFRMHEYDIDTESNEIYLMGSQERAVGNIEADWEPGIEYTIANRFIRNMMTCMRTKPGEPILVHMKSNGGYWEEGLAIRDTVRMVGFHCPVTILNYTHARSMTSMVFLAANKRVMMPNSNFMFHGGTCIMDGTHKQFMTEQKWAAMLHENMLGFYIYALKEQGSMSHWSRARIKEWLEDQMNKKEEVYMTAEEAVEAGFADEIFNGDWNALKKYTPSQKIRNRDLKL